ncbi:hypothetical protein IAD21_00178 [Abditibacteriota bacterium]|nr:hypothetical protein IAD21_00178 [Abditibacteriota bacterium]
MTVLDASPSENRKSSASPVASQCSGAERGVTPRVIVLSLVLAVAFGYVLPVVDYKWANTFMGAQHLPPGAVGVLLILVLGINPLLRRMSASQNGRWGFSRNEALTVYITCLFSSLVPGHGSENFVITNLIAPFYFATRENKWLEWLQPHIKPWLTPALNADGSLNKMASDGWYTGLGPGQYIPWSAWIIPLLFWIAFVLVSYVMLGCLSIMLRRQWAEREALAFPLLRLPLEMTEDLNRTDARGTVGQFFRNPTMWVGFGIAVIVQLVRGLHLYFPDIPDFPLEIDTGPLFSDAPWNQIGWVPIRVYPMVIGVTYLLTSEISFSLWAFFWIMKGQLVLAYMLGYQPSAMPGAPGLPDKTFTGYQQMGCYLAYVGFVLWTGREHLHYVFKRAIGRVKADADEKNEVLSYPIAFWGFIGSFALMVGATVATGVRLDIALVLWTAYLVLAIGLTRVAVEGGMLALQHHSVVLEAIGRLVNSGQSSWLTLNNGVVPASLFQSSIVNHMRGFTMPSFVHSFKLAHDHKIAPKPLGLLLVAVIVISVCVSWITCVHLGYDNSGLSLGHAWYTKEGPVNPVWFVNNMLKADAGPATPRWIWLGVGALLTYGMMVARTRFAFFPLHPIGYIMGLTYPSQTFWFSIFCGWLFKGLITRFGGNDTYRRITPAFLGLVLGDVAMILFWIAVDGWNGRAFHQLLPG